MKWNCDQVADQTVIFTNKNRSLSLLDEYVLHFLKTGTILFKSLCKLHASITHLTQ